jgi:hypothetical protein
VAGAVKRSDRREERGRQSLGESESERVGFGGSQTGMTVAGASDMVGWRTGRAAARLGAVTRGESQLAAGVGDAPLSR